MICYILLLLEIVQNDSTNSNSSSFIPKSSSVFTPYDLSEKERSEKNESVQEQVPVISKLSGRKIAQTILVPMLQQQIKLKKKDRNIMVS